MWEQSDKQGLSNPNEWHGYVIINQSVYNEVGSKALICCISILFCKVITF